MFDWLTETVYLNAIIWFQSGCLGYAAYTLFRAAKSGKQSVKVMQDQQELLEQLQGALYARAGLIIAMKAGILHPGNLPPIDLTNLPWQVRLKIMHTLIEVGVELHSPPKENEP